MVRRWSSLLALADFLIGVALDTGSEQKGSQMKGTGSALEKGQN